MSESKRSEQVRAMKAIRFGIEIETVGQTRQVLAGAIATATGGNLLPDGCSVLDRQNRTWKVVFDGSLSDSYRSGEIVSPILGYDDLPTLQEVVRAVRAAGGRSDDSTGIHIHADGSRLDAKGLVSLVRFIHKQERLLEHALGVREHRLARYCRPINADFMARLEARRPSTLDEVRRAWYGRENARPVRYDDSRY